MIVQENLVRVEHPRFTMRVWVHRGEKDPSFARDHAGLQSFVDSHTELMQTIAFDDLAELIAREFPRTAAAEILDRQTQCGVLFYPEWP